MQLLILPHTSSDITTQYSVNFRVSPSSQAAREFVNVALDVTTRRTPDITTHNTHSIQSTLP